MANARILARFFATAAELSQSLPAPKQPILRLQRQPLHAVLTELGKLVGLEHAEGFAGIVGAHQVGWVKDGAQFVSVEAVEVCSSGVELGSAFRIEVEGWTVVAEILGPRLEFVARVGEFEDTGVDEAFVIELQVDCDLACASLLNLSL
jgi:hypothetical protein